MKNLTLIIAIIFLAFFSIQNTKAQSTNWAGTYHCEPEISDFPFYVLTIESGSSGNYDCLLSASGKQTYYELNCVGKADDNILEIYFTELAAGFFNEEILEKQKPIITLVINGRGQLLTSKDQIGTGTEGECLGFVKK